MHDTRNACRPLGRRRDKASSPATCHGIVRVVLFSWHEPRNYRLDMRTRLAVVTSAAALVLASFAGGGAAGADPQSTAVWSVDAAKSLPAWGDEPVPPFGSGRSDLHAISVLSPKEAWAVGVIGITLDQNASSLVERWDGKSWSVVEIPELPGTELYGVVAIASDDVWMVGTHNNTRESLVLHWDGTSVEQVAAPNPGANRNDLYAVTATGPDDVWAVGSKSNSVTDPLTLHWDGTEWSAITAAGTASYDELRGVTAVAEDDVWAVGVLNYEAATLHWDGKKWSRVDVPVEGSGSSFSAVSAVNTDEVWAVGQDEEGTLSARWNGSGWKVVEVPDSGGYLRDDLVAVDAVASGDVWAGGTSYLRGNADRIVLHWNGRRWQPVTTPKPPESTSQLEGIAADAAGEVLVAGSLDRRASVLRREDGTFDELDVEQVGTDVNQLFGISAAASDDIWSVGALGQFKPKPLTLHYDGTTWTRFAAPGPPEGTQLEDVVTIGENDAWAVGFTDPGEFGDAVALHWNGKRWQSTKVPQPGTEINGRHLLAVDALAPDDVWAVGVYDLASDEQTMVVHWDGKRWRLVDNSQCNPFAGLRGLTFVAPDDGWAVGDATICHWNGKRWSLVPSPQPRPNYFEINYPLQDVSGAASDDVWAVGGVVYDFIEYLTFGSFVEHWDGESWQRAPQPAGTVLNGVEAVASDEVWAVGRDDYGPIIVLWNGGSWVDVPTPGRDNGVDLLSMTRADGELWSVGRSLPDGDSGYRSMVQRAPSPTQGAVIGTSNVGGATVAYTGPAKGVITTEPTGDFRVGGLPAGRYRFTLAYEGCLPVTKKVDVVAGRTRGLDLQADC